MGKAISVNLYVMEFMYSSESEPPFVIWWAHSLYFRMGSMTLPLFFRMAHQESVTTNWVQMYRLTTLHLDLSL